MKKKLVIDFRKKIFKATFNIFCANPQDCFLVLQAIKDKAIWTCGEKPLHYNPFEHGATTFCIITIFANSSGKVLAYNTREPKERLYKNYSELYKIEKGKIVPFIF